MHTNPDPASAYHYMKVALAAVLDYFSDKPVPPELKDTLQIALAYASSNTALWRLPETKERKTTNLKEIAVTNDIDLIVVCCQMLTALRTLLALDELTPGNIDAKQPLLKHALVQAQGAIDAGKAAIFTVAATAAEFAST